MQLEIDRTKSGDEKGYLTIKDGDRGVVRFTRDEVPDLADLLASFRTERTRP